MNPNQNKNHKNITIYILTSVIIILLVGLLIALKLYFDTQNKFASLEKGDVKNTTPINDTKLITEKVGKLMVLPKEQPTMITLSNIEILKKNQPFFAQAKNGDKMLIYSQKVILYDPVADKIIDVAKVNPPVPTSTTGPSTPSASLTVTITTTPAQIRSR